jgi:hypothetical protein
MIGKTAIVVVLLALGAYGFLEALPLLQGPSLTVESPVSGTPLPGGIVTIEGVVERSSSLSLNGAPLLPDENGFFEETLAFPTGTSILEFVAKDRFGRTIRTTRTIYVPE